MTIATEIIPPQLPPLAAEKPYSLQRFLGSLFMGIWIAVFVGIAWTLYSGFDQETFWKYAPKMLAGLPVTLSLVAISVTVGAVLSVPVAMARMSKSRILNRIAYVYIYFFRGTPLIAQLYLVYYGLGNLRSVFDSVDLWWFFREAYYCALLSFSLNTAAYQAEILRGAIESVSRGQWEASDALGLHRWHAFRKVILPQALIVALRPYGNEIVLMIKASAIVSIVTVFDVMGETSRAYSRTYDPNMYLWAAILYLVVVEALRHLWNWMEARLTRHLKR